MNTQPKQQAFLAAYKSCQPAFTRYCSALAYGKMDTEDLMQDVLVTAYKHFDTIKNKEQLLHYMIRAARNRSVSHWRKAKFKAELLEEHQQQLRDYGATPEVLLDVELLHQAINRLPEKQKNALLLFEISGFSMKEIAEMQRTSIGAVKVKISRGRKKLRDMMSDKKTVLALLGGLFSKEAILARTANPTVVKSLFESCRSLPMLDKAVSVQQVQTIIGQAATGSSWLSSLSFTTLNSTVMTTVSISILLVTGGILIFQNSSTPSNPTISTVEPNVQIIDEQPIQSIDTEETLVFNESVVPSFILPRNTDFLTSDNQLPDLTAIPPLNYVSPENSRLTTLPIAISDTSNPLFPRLPEPLFSDTKTPLFPEKPTSPKSIFLNESPSKPSIFDSNDAWSDIANSDYPLSPSKNDSVNSINCIPVKFTGNMPVFKQSLIQKLKSDKLITNKNMIRLTFSGEQIKVNNQLVPSSLQSKYQSILKKHNIKPCAIRMVEITKEYIAVGDVSSDGFKGRIDGRVDIDELNNRKIN